MRFFLIPTMALLLVLAGCAPATENSVVRYSKEGKWEDVRDDVKIAITNKGLVIDYVSHIGNMLDRTKKDVGGKKDIFAKAEAFVFCSAVISRQTMEADAHNIAFCPYAISVYTTPEDAKTVHVTFRRPLHPTGSQAARDSLKEVEKLLDGIAREALGIK